MMCSVGPQVNGQAIQQSATALQLIQDSIQQMQDTQQQMQRQIRSLETMVECQFENKSPIRYNQEAGHLDPLRALRKYRPGHPQSYSSPAQKYNVLVGCASGFS
eukprot:TRINITY_DN11558_c0_g2_i1.p2 TRINITY_DN11558_c0_g2~~TRINITY_DN11558_c0_g2_i1.p2  ORF type:complete len:104 (+),score=14.01 TRINITY_DN11558_c0_g2_i1:214-525(+)